MRRASSRDYGFGIVGLVGVAGRAQGVVVVVEQEQPAILQRKDALDGLEGEEEQDPEAESPARSNCEIPLGSRIESRSSTSLSIRNPSESVRLRSTR